MIDSSNSCGGSILGFSDEALDDLERAGLLGNEVPTVERTISADWHGRRFRLRQQAMRLAREGRSEDSESLRREAIRLFALSKLPPVRLYAETVAHDLRIEVADVRGWTRDQIAVGWAEPTDNAFTIDPLGPSTREVLFT